MPDKNTNNNGSGLVLVCAPTEGDGAVLERTIRRAGARAVLCPGLASLCNGAIESADIVLVTEEVLGRDGLEQLSDALARQPAWSDVPVLLLAGGREASPLALAARERLDNVLLFERPVRLTLLDSTLRMALRTRARQRQVRDLLEERNRLNAALVERLEELRRSEERFQRLYEANIIGIAMANAEIVEEANDAFLEMVGFTGEELRAGAVKWREFTPPEYAPLDERGLESLLRTGRCEPFEKEFLRRDGARVPVLIGAATVGGSRQHWLCVVLDLTERRQLERRVLQAQKLESVGLLAGGIAHDFNNLLTGILGNASLLLGEVAAGPAERIDEVIASAQRAAYLTSQLLAYSGQGQFVTREIDVSQAVNEIAGMVEFSIPKSVRLSVTTERRLPPVRMDPSQLQQVLMNLVINAGEAIGEGNPGNIGIATSLVEIGRAFVDAIDQTVAPGRYVRIEVSDTGDGIEEDKRSRIFDPFFTTKFTGRGLGLAAVAGIVRSRRGAIVLTTARGRGSTFRVLLPVAETRAVVHADDGSLGTILVADDEAAVRDFIATVLRQQGYRVLAAQDGRAALQACETEPGAIDAAVLDVVMPGMGAHELLPKIKALRPELKVLLTSGYSEFEARRLSSDYPGAAFIQKPYAARAIADAVRNLLGIEPKTTPAPR